MAKILAFAGSNSSTSINYQLVKFTGRLIVDHNVHFLDLSNFPFPMYSEDLEKKEGFSNSLIELKNEIQNADGIILSVNEHNGGLSAYFKNVLDWLSRLERKFLAETKVFLMATSPGGRGAVGSLETAKNMLPRFGANIVSTFSFPSFHENFNSATGISENQLSDSHKKSLEIFLNSL